MSDIRTEMVSFQTNGDKTDGFLAVPAGDGPFPGVIVIQEWWGLNDNIKDIARRFAAEGFAALAPDLYHGKLTAEPDEAMKLMMATDMPRASKELSKAVDFLSGRPEVSGGIGATGFCMGGGLALTLACDNPRIKAVAPFYGANPDPIDKVADIQGPVFAVYASHDDWAGPAVRDALGAALTKHGIRHEIETYADTEHAFFNDTRPEVYKPQQAADAWKRTLALFKANL